MCVARYEKAGHLQGSWHRLTAAHHTSFLVCEARLLAVIPRGADLRALPKLG